MCNAHEDPVASFTEGFKTGLLVGIVVTIFTISALYILFKGAP